MSIGNNLKRYRILNNLSLRKVGDELGFSHTLISKYEKGTIVPDSEKLIKFADLYNVNISDLLKIYKMPDVKLNNFRKFKSLSGRKLEMLKEIIKIEIAKYLEVLHLSNYDSILKINKIEVNNIDDAEVASDLLRKQLNLSSKQPIPNLIDALENAGIFIIQVDIPESLSKFDGASEIVEDKPFIIIKKNQHDGGGMRFTLAHELAHLFLSINAADKDIEKICDRFASSFLLSKENMVREFSNKRKNISYEEIDNVKKEYKVSHGAIVYRLIDLNIISESNAKGWYIYFNKKYGKKDPEAIPPEESSLYENLVYRLKTENIISSSKARELLHEKWDNINS